LEATRKVNGRGRTLRVGVDQLATYAIWRGDDIKAKEETM
jgi:hypothetical protein